MDRQFVTVFGGTGFLGRRVVQHLKGKGLQVRVASRHPERGRELFSADDPQIESIAADVHDEGSVAEARWFPAYPMFGQGRTRLQPAYVEDVAEAITTALQNAETCGMTFECGGPRVYSYQELLKTISSEMDRKPAFIPLPFAAWHVLARISEVLPSPPLTRNQVELMEIDSVARNDAPGFARLNIAPRSIEEILPSLLREVSVR